MDVLVNNAGAVIGSKDILDLDAESWDKTYRLNAREKSALLVLLSSLEYEVEKMLEMIHQAKLTTQILLKFHPAVDSKKHEKHVKESMEIVEGNLYSLFQRAGCVVGATTGSLVEAPA